MDPDSADKSPLSHEPENEEREADRLVSFQAYHSGPLPPPSELAAFDRIQPGFAERIMVMAEEQAKHRKKLELKAVDAEIEDAKAVRMQFRRGQIFGLVIAILGLTSAVAIAAVNQTSGGAATASIVGGSTVLGLVAVFVIGKLPSRRSSE